MAFYSGNPRIFLDATNPHYSYNEYNLLNLVLYSVDRDSSPGSGTKSGCKIGRPFISVFVYPLYGTVVSPIGRGCSW